MDIHHLKVFVSVYRNRSFSRASEELNLTQPTVSEHVKALGEDLGCRLFDRVGRRIVPTREADVLYSRAVEVVKKLDDIKTDISRVKGGMRGLLVIGASTVSAAYLLPKYAAEFRKKYPDVFFQVVSGNSKLVAEMVERGELVMGVVDSKMGRRGLEYTQLEEEEMLLAGAPGFFGAREMTLEELKEVPFVLREEGSGTRKNIEKILADKGVSLKSLNVVAVFGSSDSLKEAVKSGIGASILPALSARGDLNSDTLEAVRIKGLRMRGHFHAVAHAKRTLPEYYIAFLDFLKNRRLRTINL